MSVSPARCAIAAAIAIVALAAGGCGGALLASPVEYEAYRRARVEPALEARLAAAAAYLKSYPSGVYAGELRRWFERAEPVYYQAKRGSSAGLAAYLDILPGGTYAAEAQRELARMQLARAPDEVSSGADTEARIAAEQSARDRVLREVGAWIERLVDPALWRGQPMVDAPAELIVPFSLALPWPSCRLRDDGESLSCAKVLSLPYAVAGEGGSEPREATVEIAIVEDLAGRPLSATLGGPDLFLRLEEARSVRSLDADDAAAEIRGMSLAVELAGAAFRERVQADRACRREPVAPVVLDLACGGVSLRVIAAVEAGEDDRIVITPLAPLAPR